MEHPIPPSVQVNSTTQEPDFFLSLQESPVFLAPTAPANLTGLDIAVVSTKEGGEPWEVDIQHERHPKIDNFSQSMAQDDHRFDM